MGPVPQRDSQAVEACIDTGRPTQVGRIRKRSASGSRAVNRGGVPGPLPLEEPSQEKGRLAMSLEETQQRVLLTVGRMLVTQAVSSDAHFKRVCLDVEHWDGQKLTEAYKARHGKFGTTPFDPEGH